MKKITYLIALFLIAGYTQAQNGLCNPNFSYWADSTDFVTFTNNTPSNQAFTFEWDFGDNSAIDTNRNPVHQYASSGSYRVVLTVDSFGFQCSFKDDTIYVNYCNAQTSYTQGNAGSVTFYNNSAAPRYGVDYSWDFGDGTPTYVTGSKNSITHSYLNAGIYIYSMTLFDSLNNCTSTYMDSVNVISSSSCSASYTVSKDTSTAFGVILTNTSSDSASHSYSWDFGDNNSATGRTPSHQYQSFGSYVVCLTITDSLLNCVSTYCDTIGMDTLGNLKAGFGLTVVDPITVGMNKEVQTLNKVSVYPNPAKNMLSIDLQSIENKVDIKILDLSGRTILENINNPIGNVETIDISSLENGVYFILINDGTSQKTEKFIKSE